MISCEEIMTRSVVTADAQEKVINVARKMDAANVGSIPIVDNENGDKLVGIISDRDIVKRVVVTNISAPMTPVHEVMTHPVVSCQPGEKIERAMAKMAEYQVRRIPIVDENNRVVGIIAQADIARYMDSQLAGKVVEEISETTTERTIESL